MCDREMCIRDSYRRRPDVIGFSCYIWNIATIRALAADLRKVLPGIPIWLGGPEVSFDAEKVLRENPSVTGVMKGEGEETFAQLARHYVDDLTDMSDIAGLTYRNPDGTLTDTGIRPVMDLNRIPFSYHTVALKDLEHRIIYYESSRGCPFSCSYCLSSIDRQVRFLSLIHISWESPSCRRGARYSPMPRLWKTWPSAPTQGLQTRRWTRKS